MFKVYPVILTGIFFLYAGKVSGARPLVHASGLKISSIQCNSVVLSWSNGDGNARIIVAREGNPTTFTPADNEVYTSDYRFGKSLPYNGDNYIVFNRSYDTFARIDSLKKGTVYYFMIYEHDNSGSNTLYLTNGAPYIQITTYTLNLDFDVKYIDSCQDHNSYIFTNKSTSTIPGITYEFDFNDGKTSGSSPVTHTYKISGLIPAKIKALTSVQGCPLTLMKGVRVYQKKVVFFDWTNPKTDTSEQCFGSGLFSVYTGNYTNPLAGSYGYRWFTPTDTSVFSFFKWGYPVEGRTKISLEITTNISRKDKTYPTGCKDTLSFFVYVPRNPVAFAGRLSNQEQRVDTNRYIFSCTDTSLTSVKWYFGDGDSSSQPLDTHVYAASDRYVITLKAIDRKGCRYEKTFYADVLYAWNDTTSIRSPQKPGFPFRVYPNPCRGIFTIEPGKPVSSVSVLTMHGQFVREIIRTGGNDKLTTDISSLPPGIYVLRIGSGQAIYHHMITLSP